MGFFSKIKDLFSKKKKDVAEQISEKNKENTLVEQKKFDQGLKKSSSFLNDVVNEISKKYVVVNDELIEKIEEMLIQFDVGYNSTQKILDSIVDEIKYQNVNDPDKIKEIIIDKLFVYYIQNTQTDTGINIDKNKNNVFLISGVNGVGKTTSIAKLAFKYKQDGYKVLIIAGDTFRAAAVEQLEEWAKKLGVDIVKGKPEQDPTSVIYSGLEYAKNNGINITLCDTSGRLQNKLNLMNELKKMNNVIKKFDASQPAESLIVIDATTGQNGINQAKAFSEVTNLSGIILTKMDSTSKGGIVLAIKDVLNIPVKFITLGENKEDLEVFDLEKFITGLVYNINIEK